MDVSPPAYAAAPAGPQAAIDVVLGLVATLTRSANAVVRASRPVSRFALQPPLLPRPLQPRTWLATLADRGQAFRVQLAPQLDAFVSEVVDAIVARVDVDAVIDRIDIATIAKQVIDDVNLPDIIRDSTGALASETVLGMRMQSIEADDGVSRIVDRVLRRRNAPTTQVQGTDAQPAG